MSALATKIVATGAIAGATIVGGPAFISMTGIITAIADGSVNEPGKPEAVFGGVVTANVVVADRLPIHRLSQILQRICSLQDFLFSTSRCVRASVSVALDCE